VTRKPKQSPYVAVCNHCGKVAESCGPPCEKCGHSSFDILRREQVVSPQEEEESDESQC